MKRKVFLPVFLALAIFSVAILATKINANEISDYPPIVQKIADKFNLSVSEVEEVFDEERDERRADMFAIFAERLNDLVTEGKLTEEQKETLLNKHEEVQNAMEDLRNLPEADRKAKMIELHESFRSWIKDQGLDINQIGLLGKGLGMGMGRRFHHEYTGE